MPELDYAGGAVRVVGPNARPLSEVYGRPAAVRFYDGTACRGLVACTDCGLDADGLFGDHGGDCRPGSDVRASTARRNRKGLA